MKMKRKMKMKMKKIRMNKMIIMMTKINNKINQIKTKGINL